MAVPTGQSRTNAANILLKVYRPKRLIRQINLKTRLLGVLSRRGERVNQGSEVKIPVLKGKSGAGGHRAEWDDSPAPDQVRTDFFNFNLKTYHRTIRLSGEVMEDTKGEGGIASALQLEMEEAIPAARMDMERCLFLDGSGKYATVVNATDSTTLEVSDKTYVQENDILDVLIASTGAVGYGVERTRVTAITKNSPAAGQATLTLSKALGTFGSVDTTYAIYLHNTYGKDPWGLDAAIDSANPSLADFGGVERGANTWAQAQMQDAANESISSPLLQALWNKQDDAAGIDAPTFCITTPEIMIDLFKRASVLKEADHKEMKIDNWLRAVTVGGVPIWSSRFCQAGRLYSIYSPDLRIIYSRETGDGHWVTGTDGSLHKVVNKYGFEALWIRRWQFAARRVNSQGRLYNINWAETGTV